MSLHPRTLRLAAVAWLTLAAPVRADPPADVDSLLQTGHAELRQAAIGHAGAAERARAAFQDALDEAPGLPAALAGRGLALLAHALEAPMAQKLSLARQGCADLDAAVAAAPEDPSIRLLRAAGAIKMPLLLQRQTIAESDFQILLAAARDAKSRMAADTRRGIFYHAAAFALKERRAEAVDLLEQAASIPASEPSDEQVQSMLALARRHFSPPSHADSHPSEKTPASRP